jgi:hypothetical protein
MNKITIVTIVNGCKWLFTTLRFYDCERLLKWNCNRYFQLFQILDDCENTFTIVVIYNRYHQLFQILDDCKSPTPLKGGVYI